MIKSILKNFKSDDYQIDIGTKVPVGSETMSTLLAGSEGTGKSVVIKKYIKKALSRNQIGVCLDFRGEHSRELARERDLVLDTSKGVSYSPLTEMQRKEDARLVANILISTDEMEARNALVKILEQLWDERDTGDTVDNCRFIELLMDIEANDPCFAPLIKALRALKPDAGFDKGFSVRKWFCENEKLEEKPFLFMHSNKISNSKAQYIAAVIAGFYIEEVLNLNYEFENDPEKQRRCWLIVDDLPDYPAIPRIMGALEGGWLYGMAIVAAIRWPSQLYRIYGEKESLRLLSCFLNKVIFNQPDRESAKYWSEYIEHTERILRDNTRSSCAYQEPLVPHSDLFTMRPLEAVGLFSLSGKSWENIEIPY